MKVQCNDCDNSQKAKLKGYDVPKEATILKSSHCPNCEDEAIGEHYEEWFEDSNGKNLGKAN